MSDATMRDPSIPTRADDAQSRAIERAYEAMLFVGRPWPNCHPARIATIAALVGFDTFDPASARVLEIGCGDGGNLVPIAAACPGSDFTGIDLSQRAIGEARAFAEGCGLDNIRFVHADLRELHHDGRRFDYIIAHGFYSWVPEPVRDALFETIRATLSPDGIAFVSHNTLPGCALRSIVWGILGSETAGIDDPRERIARAREIAATMAEAMRLQPGAPSQLATEFDEIATRPDYALFHDDISVVNHAVLLRDFAAHAGRHRLAWLADADLYRHIAPAFGERGNAWVAQADRIGREHRADHIRLRRFRESLLVPIERGLGSPVTADRLARMHIAAANDTVERSARARPLSPADRSPAALRRRLLDQLVEIHPLTAPVGELVEWVVRSSDPGSALAQPAAALQMVLASALAGATIPYAEPPALARVAGERPRAFAPARWQATRRDFVVNLRHDGVLLDGESQRRLLPLLDGTRTQAELAARSGEWSPAGAPTHPVGDHLAHFVRLGLLEL